MDNTLNNIQNNGETPKAVVDFIDGRMASKNESTVYTIIKNVFIVFVVILVIGSIIFKEFLFSGESIAVWLCVIIVLGYLIKNGGHERVETLSQLLFFRDYMVFYVPKHHVKKGLDRMEIQKIYYRDVITCEFRTNTRKMVIRGMLDQTYYEYEKNGVVNSTPSYQRRYDGMIKFYTVFDYEHDFKAIIEKNSPLTVVYQNA